MTRNLASYHCLFRLLPSFPVGYAQFVWITGGVYGYLFVSALLIGAHAFVGGMKAQATQAKTDDAKKTSKSKYLDRIHIQTLCGCR